MLTFKTIITPAPPMIMYLRRLSNKLRCSSLYITDRYRLLTPIERLNHNWKKLQRIPSFLLLRDQYSLPHLFKSLEQFKILFPILDKSFYIKAYSSCPRNPKKFLSTSGSTGQSFRVPMSNRDLRWRYFSSSRFRECRGIDTSLPIITLWGNSSSHNGALYPLYKVKRQIMDYVGGTLRYEAYSLDDFTFAVIVRKIIQIETFTIYAYTSFAKAFAQYLITNSVSIPAPQSVVVTSEVTSNKDIDLLASIFGCPIYCEYGLVEFGPVFIKESTNANYIINSSSFLAEQDPNNQLVITDLADLDYPFLRYVTGDEVLSPSEIQAPFLTELIDIRGRHCDIVKITTTAGVVSAHSEIVSHALKIFDSVLDFQCHTCQGMLDRISIVISQSQNQAVSNSQLSRMILDQLSKYLGSDPLNIEIHFTTKLVRGSSGKKINIIREAA